MPLRRHFLAIAVVLTAACGSQSSPPPATLPSPSDFMDTLQETSSCVLDCDPACTEAVAPWACPALNDWTALPHDATACNGFDGKAYPAPQHGACKATDPTGDALEKTNASGSPPVLPDGRRIEPAGTEWLFTDFPGGFPSAAMLVPGTKWLLVVDTGYTTHSVRAVDTGVLRAGGATNPVASSVRLDPPKALNWGMAYAAGSNVLYVASGYHAVDNPNAQVFAYDFDTTSGKLTPDVAKSVPLPAGTFPQAVAVSADGKTMLVGQANDSRVLVVTLGASPTVAGKIDLGQPDVFEIRFDPNDPSGNTAYATVWLGPVQITDSTSMRLAQIDVAGRKATILPVGKLPEDMAFLDARYMVVANALSDSLSIVDRPAGKVAATVPLGTAGLEPTALAYDAPRKRLYATLSSSNAVQAFDVDMTATPPALAPVGRIPTSWWPTAVVADPADGTLYVTTGRGHGTQGLNVDGDNGSYLQGSVQAVPPMDGAGLAAASAKADGDDRVQGYAGYSTVDCGGAPYDFPIPQKIEDGPSPVIQHVYFIVRENKTFDALFGDMPGVDGEPKYILSPQRQSTIWANARKWATEFAHMDNFYEDAEQSIQGHYWTVYGRTTDVDERRWIVTWARGEFNATQSPGVSDYSAPLEGSIFSSLRAQGVTLTNGGELVGGIAYRDQRWPSGTSDSTIPDTLGACYLAAHARVVCDPPQFTYAWLGNDHTFGLAAGKPNPALMMSVNDEATGMLLDGISHSPFWASSLVVVVEDDPSTGQDHVDQHRTIALFASPWIKRGYVSHAHYDVASVHKLFAHVFGKPYRNREIADAPLPLDLFTSTPDFTPFDFVPRSYTDGSCNPSGTTGSMRAQVWDFSHPDEQPGLDEQLEEYFRDLK
jgi:DNA-binding beta-propeller fold protein YncE